MSHFAEVINGTVRRVIVAEQDFIDSGAVGDPANWVQTSYNTTAGRHTKNAQPLRKNYAGKGMGYDRVRDAFIPTRPFPSWSLDDQTCTWKPPIAMPKDGKRYAWDENTRTWVALKE